jgi:hypothetical protein
MENNQPEVVKKIPRECLRALPELYQKIALIAERRGLIELI